MKKFFIAIAVILLIVAILIGIWTYLYGSGKLPDEVMEWVHNHPKIDNLSKAFVRHSFFRSLYENVKEDYEIITSTPTPGTH